MKQFSSPDGNLFGHIAGRSLNCSQVLRDQSSFSYPICNSIHMHEQSGIVLIVQVCILTPDICILSDRS